MRIGRNILRLPNTQQYNGSKPVLIIIFWLQIVVLHKTKLRNNPHCYYCIPHEETTSHLFWHCGKIQQFMKDLTKWVDLYNIKCDMNEDSFILGINKTIVFQKYYVLYCCMQNITYTLPAVNNETYFWTYLKNAANVQNTHRIAISNDKLNNFIQEWDPYQNLINSIMNLQKQNYFLCL